MPNPEWGTKRLCPTTGKRFYDLNKDPIVSPYTGEIVTLDNGKHRTMIADAEDAQTKKMKMASTNDEDDLILDDEDENDVDLDDDILEEDEDDDNVSFDDLGDVAADEE